MRFTGRTRTELHFHLLPRVDDGPPSLAEALDLARMAVADGTGRVVCTPHAHLVDVETIAAHVRAFEAALRGAEIPLAIGPGGEITAGTPLTRNDLELLAQGPPGRRWLMLEAPLDPGRLDAFNADADAYTALGYGLLIGHPERCPDVLGELDWVLERGAALQVNASSVIGAHGEDARAAAFELVARGVVAALASDAHGPERPPCLRAASAALRAAGHDADALTTTGPARLLREGLPPARSRRAA